MAYTSGFTAVTGATYTAAQYNTNTRDNFTAIWVYTTAGDIAYATGATTLARLANPGNGYYLESATSSVQWTQFKRYMSFQLNTDIALNVGDDAIRFRIPAALNGWNISSVAASRKSGTGVPAFQIRNVTDAVDVLSTKLTIDSGETDSSTAATPAVINTSTDDVATADQFAIDVDVAGTATLYAYIEIGFTKP
jgi:hypothetical protein